MTVHFLNIWFLGNQFLAKWFWEKAFLLEMMFSQNQNPKKWSPGIHSPEFIQARLNQQQNMGFGYAKGQGFLVARVAITPARSKWTLA